ncbi:hypothetical protein F3I16_15860 [Pseudomonas sp. L-22-4S-12]|uniref:hypothetical protein n=1 Tax=Pseudomonas sp. L-22-4S-12 TaxID=2610893 RepID=UPI0013239D0A|nr:hypothetical protein [Pseudomonas sp. L-22-4S-12]MWV17518.1 hypothetical protein [Pseudomonas sp. L-22-4S-12]
MSEEQKIEALKKVLGEPIGFDISDAALKVKRNLMLVSLVVIVLVLGELKTSSKISIFGVSLDGVTPDKMMLGLAVVLIYSLIHYLWYCFELAGEWSLRVTGARLGFVTGAQWAEEGIDYPADPKQSTLYTWWLQEIKSFAYYKDLIAKVEEHKEEIDKRIEDIVKNNNPGSNGAMASNAITQLKGALEQARSSVSKAESIIANQRINVSLERFDKRFGLVLRSQNLRVLLAEILLPIFMAGYAGLLLATFFELA